MYYKFPKRGVGELEPLGIACNVVPEYQTFQ